MDSRLQCSRATRGALRTEYEDDDEGAEAVHGSIPPGRAHAPPHDTIADYKLSIMVVSITVHGATDEKETRRTLMPRAIVIIHDCFKTSALKAVTSASVCAPEKRPACACETRRSTLAT